MPHMNDHVALGASVIHHLAGLRSGGFDPDQGKLAGVEIFVLDIDGDNGASGHETLL
ncbi:hypothetical protein D3C80_1534730 [compost metagenome]